MTIVELQVLSLGVGMLTIGAVDLALLVPRWLARRRKRLASLAIPTATARRRR